MKVLVDTSVWSLALRRPANHPLSPEQRSTVSALGDLVRDGRAMMIGAIRQELLSGIKTESQFEVVRDSLGAFDDVLLSREIYESAAQAFNSCRANGVQGSNTDFLICAVSMFHHVPIFSLDGDFKMYQRWLPVLLYVDPSPH